MSAHDDPSVPLTDAQYELLRRLGVTREDLEYLKENSTMNERTDHAADPERKGIIVRAPKRVWEPLPVGGESDA